MWNSRRKPEPVVEERPPRKTEVTFEGLEPWTPGPGLTRCRVGDREFDLREDATFLGYDFGEYGMLTLRWYHDPDGADPRRLTLDFDYLRGFRAEPAHGGSRLPGETEGWTYRPGDAGRADFAVYAGEHNLFFSAGGVRLRVTEG
ncbi:MAG TPA: hypothetical protein VGD72_04605 [Mycobacteriales bacterium]